MYWKDDIKVERRLFSGCVCSACYIYSAVAEPYWQLQKLGPSLELDARI
jgi:hypothetical protein